MTALYLLLPSACLILLGILLHRRVRPNQLWLVLLALTLPIASVNTVGDDEVNFALSDITLVLLMLHGLALAPFAERKLRLPLLGLIAPFVLWVVLSLIVGINRFGLGTTALYIVSFLKFIALFLYFFALVNLVRAPEDLSLFLRAWVLGSTLIAALGIAGSLLYITGRITTPFNEGFRAHGTFEEANLFAAYCLLSFFLAFTLLIDTPGLRARTFIILAMGIQTLALIFSASRGASIAYVVSLAMLGLLSGSNKFRLALLAVVAIPLLTFVALRIGSPTLLEKVEPVIRRLMSAQDLESQAHLRRYFLWNQAIYLFEQHPVLGVGSGNFKHIIAKEKEMRISTTPHNTFLRLLSETGIVGLLLFLAFVAHFVTSLLRRLWNRRQAVQPLMAACLLAALGAIAIHGLASDFGNFRPFWALLGLIYAFDALHPLGPPPRLATVRG